MCTETVPSYTSVQCNITSTQSGTQALCAEAMAEEVRQPRAIDLMTSVETFRSSEGSVPKRHLPELSLLGVESILVLVMRAVTSRGPPSSYFPNNTLAPHSATIHFIASHYVSHIIVTTFRGIRSSVPLMTKKKRTQRMENIPRNAA